MRKVTSKQFHAMLQKRSEEAKNNPEKLVAFDSNNLQESDEDWRRLGRLKPEEKVAMMMDMTSACVRVCADGIRAQNPGISDEELLAKLRERLEWPSRDRLHEGKR